MTRDIARDLSSVIKANTESKTLEELAAQGKRRVRVVSGQKVMRLIQAIVDDTIQRATLENAQKDRDRIVSETKGQFDRVLRIQQEQDEVIREQKELAEKYRREKDDAERRVQELELDAARVRRQSDDLTERELVRERTLTTTETKLAAAESAVGFIRTSASRSIDSRAPSPRAPASSSAWACSSSARSWAASESTCSRASAAARSA